ncbi:phosphate ABC transporter substrate-binding protein PstS [soil metagenome]
MLSRKFLLALTCSGALAIGVAACGDSGSDSTTSGGGGGGTDLSGEIAGAGASSQEAAMEAWIAGVTDASPDVSIAYDPVGSGGGREQFNAGGVVFAGTDSAFADDELTAAQKVCEPGEFIQVPVYVSPIAIAYNLEGVDDLQLSAETLASIFAQKITKWNDPAIAKDNPDADLPDTDITPVNRSDDSGTTNNFTQYLSATAPDVWTFEPDDAFPVKGGEAADGTSGVVEAIGAGDGTIGYADDSQVGDLSVASIQIGKEYVAPSPEGAAKLVESAKDTDPSKTVFSYELNRTTTDPSEYPITLVSSQAACTQYDDENDAALVKALMSYIVSPDGQKAAAENAGSAPLSDAVTKQVEPIVDSIGS